MNDTPLFPNLQTEGKAPPAAPAGGAPAATIEPAAPAQAAPDLFGEPAAPAAAQASAESGVVNAVVSQNDPEKGQILGPKPKTSSGLDVRASHFNYGSFLFKISIVLALLVYGFFYAQFSLSFPNFIGENPAQKLATYEASFQGEQSSVNLYNYLIAKFALDDFTSAADTYLLNEALYESDHTSDKDRDDLAEDMADLEGEMVVALEVTQEKLKNHLYPLELVTTSGATTTELENSYTTLLKTKISSEKQALRGAEDSESALETSNLDGALALLNAKDLQRDIKALDLEEGLDSDTIESLFTQTTAISKNQTATILAIKNTRVDWQVIIDEVETITKKVDPLFGSGITSNIAYSNYSFNKSNEKASVRGETRTDDTLNFSVISDLVDELELSSYFADVTTRSFNKSESSEDDFMASFSLEMLLQEDEDDRDAATAIVVMEAEEEEEEGEDFTEGSASFLDVLKGLFGGSEAEKAPVPRIRTS
jgi:hypothetical protein